MKRGGYFALFVCWFFVQSLCGQELIKNGNFNEVQSCPDFLSQFERVRNWSNPSKGTPDLYHRCAGAGPCIPCVPNYYNTNFQEPVSGDGFAGIQESDGGSDYREYIRSELEEPLVPGQAYEFSMYISLADHCQVTTVCPQVDFSIDDYQLDTYFGFFGITPDIDFDTIVSDKDNWVRLTQCFIAQEESRFITIGNFKTDREIPLVFLDSMGVIILTTYYLIDGVSLQKADTVSAELLPDTLFLCQPDTLEVTLPPGRDYTWSDGVRQNPRYFFQAGKYWVSTESECGTYLGDTVYVVDATPANPLLPDSIFLCEGDSTLIVSSGNTGQHFWSDGTTGDSIWVKNGGPLWLETSTACDTRYDTVVVTITPLPQRYLPADSTLCEGDTLVLIYEGQDMWTWYDGSTLRKREVSESGLYTLQIRNHCGALLDSTYVFFESQPSLTLPDSLSLCEGEVEMIVPTTNQPNWVWSDGSQNVPYEVRKSETVWAIARNTCGEASDTLRVQVFPIPTFDVVTDDQTVCEDEVAILYAHSNNASLRWVPTGEISDTIYVDAPGVYMVVATNLCGEVGETIYVSQENCEGCVFFVPNAFTPNGDDANDFLEIFSECEFEKVDFRIFSRWGELVYHHGGEGVMWDGRSDGRALPVGVYAYILKYDFGGESHVVSGSITLMR